MKIKNLLLLLSALMFAAPAWAADTAGAPANPPASASSAQAAPADQPSKETSKKAKKKKKKIKSAATNKSILTCTTGCALMACPTTVKCCNTITHQPC